MHQLFLQLLVLAKINMVQLSKDLNSISFAGNTKLTQIAQTGMAEVPSRIPTGGNFFDDFFAFPTWACKANIAYFM